MACHHNLHFSDDWWCGAAFPRLVIYISSFVKYLFSILPILYPVVCLLIILNYKSSLYIMDISPFQIYLLGKNALPVSPELTLDKR